MNLHNPNPINPAKRLSIKTMRHEIPAAINAYRNDGVIGFCSRTLSYLAGKFAPEYTYRDISGFECDFVFESSQYMGDLEDERDIIGSFIRDINEGDVVYDIGANLGIYSSFAGAKLQDSGSVYAFEPNPAALSLLFQNMELNCDTFEAFSLAVSDTHGFGRTQAEFATGGDIDRHSGIIVKVDLLRQIVTEFDIPNPDVVKIDVEGAEANVLEGMGDLLHSIDVLYVEVHEEKGKKFESGGRSIRSILSPCFEEIAILGRQRRGKGVQKHIKATSRR